VFAEIRFRYAEVTEPECIEDGLQPRRIVGIDRNEYVQVAGVTGESVDADGVSADHEEPNPVLDE
jgi:L-ascorbate metabolism protein UlaG (beta-lactamase superfamily)